MRKWIFLVTAVVGGVMGHYWGPAAIAFALPMGFIVGFITSDLGDGEWP